MITNDPNGSLSSSMLADSRASKILVNRSTITLWKATFMPFSVDNMTSAPLELPKLCHCLAGHLGSVDVSFAAKSLLTNLTVDAILVLVFIRCARCAGDGDEVMDHVGSVDQGAVERLLSRSRPGDDDKRAETSEISNY